MRIFKASAAMAGLTKKVWKNTMLTIKTKTQVYQACVLSTLLYGSESWTPYTQQERRFTDPQKGLHSATKTCSSRTSRRVALRQQALKRWQRTAAVGDTLPSQLSRQQRRKREEQWEENRARRRQTAETDTAPLDYNAFTCSNCNRVCRSRIGLYSHSQRCSSTTD